MIPALTAGFGAERPDALDREVAIWVSAGEKPRWRAVLLPVQAQALEMALRQRDEAILLALPLANVDHHPTAVDIADLESQGFSDASARGVERHEEVRCLRLGFPEWTSFAVGDGVEPEEFLLINAVGLVLFTVWTLAAFRERRMDWIVASLATLLGLNGVLHAVASILVGRYSSGTATGLLLSLPFSVVVLRASVAGLPRAQVFGAIMAGVL